MTARPVEQSLFPDFAPDRPRGPIPGSVQTGTNADLIATIAPLYLEGRSVLDVTYGDGKWWTRYQPDRFTAHDLHKLDGVDFRQLPEADRSVDVVCFDPPYVLSGGASSPRLGPAFQDRYGIGDDNFGFPVGDKGRDALRALILDGLTDCARVAREWLIVKCMEFAQGGRFHDIPHLVTGHLAAFGLTKHDQIVHATGSGPGGHNIWSPVRARRHHSYLLVFKVPD